MDVGGTSGVVSMAAHEASETETEAGHSCSDDAGGGEYSDGGTPWGGPSGVAWGGLPVVEPWPPEVAGGALFLPVSVGFFPLMQELPQQQQHPQQQQPTPAGAISMARAEALAAAAKAAAAFARGEQRS